MVELCLDRADAEVRFLHWAPTQSAYASCDEYATINLFPGSSAVERRTVNPNVVGSIPARGARIHGDVALR